MNHSPVMRHVMLAWAISLLAWGTWEFSCGYNEAFLRINHYRTPILEVIMPWCSQLGEGWFMTVIALLFLAHTPRESAITLSTTLLCTLLVNILKHQVFPSSVRPSAWFEPGQVFTVEGTSMLSQHSFPSGHTMAAYWLFTLLAFRLKKPWAIACCFMAAASTGYARIYLGQHFPLDVLGGAATGGFCAMSMHFLWQKITVKWEGFDRSWRSLLTRSM